MKTKDILMYGAGAFVLYEFILKPKTTHPVYPPGTVIQPVNNGGLLPSSTASSLTSLFGGIVKALGGGGSFSNPASSNQNAINQYYNSAGADQGIFSTGFNYGSTPAGSTASTGGGSSADQSAYGNAFDYAAGTGSGYNADGTPVYSSTDGYTYSDPSTVSTEDPNLYYG